MVRLLTLVAEQLEVTKMLTTLFCTYTAGGISAGYQMAVVEDNTQGGADEELVGVLQQT